jgi:hypothetical protein
MRNQVVEKALEALRQVCRKPEGAGGPVSLEAPKTIPADASITDCGFAAQPGIGTGMEFPTRRCRACNSWLYWVSVHGVVVCSTCHPPPSAEVVRTWYWLPEGECKKTQ